MYYGSKLQRVQRTTYITRALQARGQPVDAAACAAARGGRENTPSVMLVNAYLLNNPAKFHPDPI